MKKLFLAIGLSLMITAVSAQKKSNFEGVIVYDMAFEGPGLPPEALALFKGSTVTTYIKNDKRRVDTQTPTSSQSVIMDEKNKSMISLMEVMGQKYLVKMNPEEVKKEGENALVPVIKYLEETKTIAGYKCKKAEVTYKNQEGIEETVMVFYTEEFSDSDFRPAYKGLKGFPMEYTMNQSGMKITLTASKVSKEKIEDTKFEAPKEGYKETTLDELQNELMKLGGQ